MAVSSQSVSSQSIMAAIREAAVIPVVRTQDAASAVRAVDALIEGGIACAEITMTVNGAVQAIETLADKWGDKLLLGAGTVLDGETVRTTMLAGAQFFVSPALNHDTIAMARRYGKPVFPGALTPTEVLAAWEAGADAIKIFPCSAVGGASYIKALKGPFPQIEFVPTGGVNLDTVDDFMRAGCWAVGVGSELIDAKSLAEEQYHVVTSRAQAFRGKVARHRSPQSGFGPAA